MNVCPSYYNPLRQPFKKNPPFNGFLLFFLSDCSLDQLHSQVSSVERGCQVVPTVSCFLSSDVTSLGKYAREQSSTRHLPHNGYLMVWRPCWAHLGKVLSVLRERRSCILTPLSETYWLELWLGVDKTHLITSAHMLKWVHTVHCKIDSIDSTLEYCDFYFEINAGRCKLFWGKKNPGPWTKINQQMQLYLFIASIVLIQ